MSERGSFEIEVIAHTRGKKMNKHTIVTVTTELKVSHEASMTKKDIKDLATSSVHCSEIGGASAEHGCYGVKELKSKRVVDINDG